MRVLEQLLGPGVENGEHADGAPDEAAIAALLREGIRPHGQWSHAFVQAQLVGVLINQRKRYDPQLRRVVAALSEIQQHVQKEVRTVERLLPAGDDHGVPQQQRGARK